MIPISSGSTYHAGVQGGVWDKLDVQEPYTNTVVNDTGDTDIDSGVALSWEVSVGAGNQVTRSNYTKITIP